MSKFECNYLDAIGKIAIIMIKTAAYLLGARQALPDINDEEFNGTRSAVQSWYSDLVAACAQSEVEKDNCMDMFDSMRATMDVPKAYKHMGWRLSTAHRVDPVHWLLTTQDLDSAFKAARTEQNSGQKKTKVIVEVVNTMPGMGVKSKQPQIGSRNPMESRTITSRDTLPYTKELENVKNKLRCSEHHGQALGENTYCWVDVLQPNAPHYPLCTRDLQEWAKHLMRQGRSLSLLQRVPTKLISPIIHNHVHLPPSVNTHNGARFFQQNKSPLMLPQPLKRTFALYMESDEESEDDEPLFYEEKDEHVKAGRKVKGKRKARSPADNRDEGEENVQTLK
ncbi:hypothetical protein EDD22DRAFT_851708 [Suillus occidentalis]|nr:hypothetical protein EDD22DRAFT_851708 [Suillus occidentalis]